jgi:hypothetical protein
MIMPSGQQPLPPANPVFIWLSLLAALHWTCLLGVCLDRLLALVLVF